MTVTPEAIRAKVDERCQRLRTDKIDLLQFHWQFVSFTIPQEHTQNALLTLYKQYNDPQYIDAMKYLQQDSRVKHLGLCNFDTEHMEKAIQSGVKVYTNQVQVCIHPYLDPRSISPRPIPRPILTPLHSSPSLTQDPQ
jgi:diketogulonate reductase-like aldo/keto reductase